MQQHHRKPTRTVLTLDGGGTNGRIQVVFLALLEEALGRPLRDVFDAVGGVSAGALLGATLVYTDTTAKQLRDEVFTQPNAETLMPNARGRSVLSRHPKFNGMGKTAIINRVLPDTPMCETPKHNLVLISAYDVSRGKGVFFKSYDPMDRKRGVSIRNVVDATSAAPALYPTVEIKGALPGKDDGVMRFAADGGLFCNDVTDSFLADLALLWRDCEIIFVSVGTGIKPRAPVGDVRKKSYLTRWTSTAYAEIAGERTRHWGGIQWLTEGRLLDITNDAPLTAVKYRMQRLCNLLGHKYIRVNVPHGKKRHIDDPSPANFAELDELGRKMFEEYGPRVLDTLRVRLDELRDGTAWDRKAGGLLMRQFSEAMPTDFRYGEGDTAVA